MTVAEWISFWHRINKTELSIKYYYNNKPIYLFQLQKIKEPLRSIKINISCKEVQEDDIEIYSNKDMTYNQEQFYNTLRARIPSGSFMYVLNIYLN